MIFNKNVDYFQVCCFIGKFSEAYRFIKCICIHVNMANGFAFKEWIKFQSRWTRFICLSNENVNESKQHISRTSVRSLSVAGTRKTNTVKDSKILPIKICTNATQDVFSTVNIRHLSMTSCFHRYRQNKFDTDDSRSWDTDHEEGKNTYTV